MNMSKLKSTSDAEWGRVLWDWLREMLPDAACCLKLSQLFARQALAKATGLSNNGATSQIGRWLARGLVKRVGSNQYERTAKFPQKTSIKPAAAERVHVPGLDPDPKGSIEDQLARSLKTC